MNDEIQPKFTLESAIKDFASEDLVTEVKANNPVTSRTLHNLLAHPRTWKQGAYLLFTDDLVSYIDSAIDLLNFVSDIAGVDYYREIAKSEQFRRDVIHEEAHYQQGLNLSKLGIPGYPESIGKIHVFKSIRIWVSNSNNVGITLSNITKNSPDLPLDHELYMNARIGMAPHYNEEASPLSPMDLTNLEEIFAQCSDDTPLLNSLKSEYEKVLKKLED